MKVDMYVLCTPQQDEEASASPSFITMWPKTIFFYKVLLESLFLEDFTRYFFVVLVTGAVHKRRRHRRRTEGSKIG